MSKLPRHLLQKRQKGGRLALSVKSWPHNCEAWVRQPRRLFPWARNLALSSWVNAAAARGGPKIATALCAITCCITLLYCVRMPSLHYASSAVIHVSWLCAPFHSKQSMQLGGKPPYARRTCCKDARRALHTCIVGIRIYEVYPIIVFAPVCLLTFR